MARTSSCYRADTPLFPQHFPEVDTTPFWFMMQTGMMLDLLISYPANWWQVHSLVASINITWR